MITNHIINFLTNTVGITNAKSLLDGMNQELRSITGTNVKVVGIEKLTHDSNKATTALLRLKDAATGYTGTARATFGRQETMSQVAPAGLAWNAKAGRWQGAQGRFVAAPAGFERGPQQVKELGAYRAELDKVSTSTMNADKVHHSFLGTQVKLAARAMAVIPIWMAFRAIWSGLIGLISGSISEWGKLDEQMGRVSTVTRGTTQDIKNLEEAVMNYGATSTRSFSDSAKAIYALGSAGLNVNQQMAGFTHIMNLAIGTMGQTEQTAKLVAGVYNVFGDSLKGVYTEAAKFKKISDLIAYTYSTQQVELDEIATAMSYVASVSNIVNVGFEDLVTTIGVLNTGMLKGSKAGTSLLNAFVKVAQNSEKLGELGVVFDPEAPLDFRDVVQQLSSIYGENAQSLTNLKEIMEVFGLRGGRAMAQLITDFDRWKKSIDDADATFEDYAEKMRKEMEDTLPGATKKLGNAIKRNLIDLMKDKGIQGFINRLADVLEQEGRGTAFVRRFGEEALPPNYRVTGVTPTMWKGTDNTFATMEGWKNFAGSLLRSPLTLGAGAIEAHTWEAEQGKIIAGALREGDEDLAVIMQQILEGRKKITAEYKKEISLEEFIEKLSKEKIEDGKDEVALRGEIADYIAEGEITGYRFSQLNAEQQERVLDAVMKRVALQETEKENESELVKLAKKRVEEAQKFVSSLEDAFAGDLATAIEENLGLAELGKRWSESLGKAFREEFSTGVIEQLFEFGGLGGQLGAVGNTIRHAFEGPFGKIRTSADYHATVIKKAIVEAATIHRDIIEGKDVSKYADMDTNLRTVLSSGQLGGGFTLPGFGQGGWWNTPMETKEGEMIPMTLATGQTGFIRGPSTKVGATPSQLLALSMSSTMSGVAGAQTGGAVGGVLSGLGGLGMGIGALQGAEAGIFSATGMLGSSMIPGIGLALALGSMIYSLTRTPPKWTKEESQEQTKQIGSRIDITNKQLEWVNRNLVALRQEITFILPDSAYFAEGRTADEFAIDSQRGLI